MIITGSGNMETKTRGRFAVGLVLALCLAATGTALAEEKLGPFPEGEVRVEAGIEFVVRDTGPVLGDLLFPPGESESPRAGLVMVHGGGFVTGSRKFLAWERMARVFANAGFVVWNVDYRLLNQGGSFPYNVHDAFCAVKWFRGRAGEYGVDPERIGLLGASAGGYLAAFVAAGAGLEELHGPCPGYDDEDPRVLAAVIINGVFDLDAIEGTLGNLIASMFYRKLPPEFEGRLDELKRLASPINHIDNAPPMLLIHGDIDVLVSVEQSRAMTAALEAAGRDATYIEFPGRQHGFVDEGYPGPDSVRAVTAAMEFLEEHLAEQKE